MEEINDMILAEYLFLYGSEQTIKKIKEIRNIRT